MARLQYVSCFYWYFQISCSVDAATISRQFITDSINRCCEMLSGDESLLHIVRTHPSLLQPASQPASSPLIVVDKSLVGFWVGRKCVFWSRVRSSLRRPPKKLLPNAAASRGAKLSFSVSKIKWALNKVS